MPILRQRLIYRGRQLEAENSVESYKIENEHVIHLVCKTEQPVEPQTEVTQVNRPVEQEVLSSMIEFPSARTAGRRRRIRSQNFDITESFEAIHQNMETLDNLNRCRKKFDREEVRERGTIVPFDMRRSEYRVGQWVDVIDTIDAWLDAQIIEVRDRKAYVHYNGWGVRWDEWISFDSPRIAPLKTYTHQSMGCVYNSPYPEVPVDANMEPQARSIDTMFYLNKASKYLGDVLSQINTVKELQEMSKTEKKEESINKFDEEALHNLAQLIPFLDRTGRMMSDLSLQLSHLLPKSSLYPNLVLGKNPQLFNNNEEFIPLEKKVEEKAEKKIEPKMEKKVEKKVEEKVENLFEPKVEKKAEPKIEEKVEQKVETKIEPKQTQIEPKLEKKLIKQEEDSLDKMLSDLEKQKDKVKFESPDQKPTKKREERTSIDELLEEAEDYSVSQRDKERSEPKSNSKVTESEANFTEKDSEIKRIEKELNDKDSISKHDSDSEEQEQPQVRRTPHRSNSDANPEVLQSLLNRISNRINSTNRPNRSNNRLYDPNYTRGNEPFPLSNHPKIKLQVPALFTAGEVNSIQGNPLGESNIDIVIHTIVQNRNTTNQTNASEQENQTLNSNTAEEAQLSTNSNYQSNQPNEEPNP